MERLERAAAGDLERARGRHGAGGRRRARGHGERVELRGRVRGRGEDAGRVRARAAEDGVFERGELRLLVPDVVLERGDVLADDDCEAPRSGKGKGGRRMGWAERRTERVS